MRLVVDVNVVLAVVLGEPEREWAIAAAVDCDSLAPRSFPFEIGNALTSLVKRKRLSSEDMLAAWRAAATFQVTLRDVDMSAALRLAGVHNIYAYDAYILQCAIDSRAKLLTLDQRMAAVGRSIGLDVVET
ncbi:MAG: type II toxin-antitoxin system VapC family toxin [Hyphomicrobiaceae bacterium]